jgi:hypothetical protein
MNRWTTRTIGLALTVLAAILLWRWSGRAPADPAAAGGPLFSFAAAQVEALEVRRVHGTSRLRREPGGGWTLIGLGADLVDPDRVEAALATLVEGAGFGVLPGTAPDERRFGFGGENATELVFHLVDGSRHRLALGDFNPVSEMVYASGAGRPGVFGVGGLYYTAAARLPDGVRLPRLLPPLHATDVDSLRLARRGGETLTFARLADGRWWLRRPAGETDWTGRAARYHDRYRDRRLLADGAVWWLADAARVRDMVFRASDTAVLEFADSAGIDDAARVELGLAPPYRMLDLWPRDAPPWRLAFGEQRERERPVVPVLRQGALVLARAEAVLPLEGAVSDFLDLGALTFGTDAADSFKIDEPRRPLLWARKAVEHVDRRLPTRLPWDPVVPAGWELAFGAETTRNQLADLQIALDRLDCVEVLDPRPEDPLAARERWRLRVWFAGGRLAEVWLGRLPQDGRAAVWDPADGKCLVVPEEILISLRNLREFLRPV